MGRSPCCSKEGLNRGAWTAMEDKILISYIKIHGEGKWRNLPKRAGLKRCGKSCRLRWLNYLRPDIKRGNISRDEEELIIRLHNLLGNRWSLIAGRLPGRTDNEIKNYWNTTLGKKAKPSAEPPTATSPPSSKAKGKTAPDFPNPTQALPSSSPVAKAIRPQAVRTRATTQLIMADVVASNPNLDDQDCRVYLNPQVGSVDQRAQDWECSRIHLGTNEDVLESCSLNFHFSNFGCDDDRFQARNDGGGEKYSYFEDYNGNDLSTEEAILESWAARGGGGGGGGFVGENNEGTLDCDSLAFLVDSEEWTCP